MESRPSPSVHDKPATLTIAGFTVTLYGLSRLPSSPCPVTVVHLLHPRLETSTFMVPIAESILSAHHASDKSRSRGLICLTFDQRNHGTRLVEALKNEDWRNGNSTHGIDMFASYHGTSLDLSSIIDYLPAYLFPEEEYTIVQHIVAGVSLGGHAAWLSVLHDPRIMAAGVIVGCADLATLMQGRGEKSRLDGFVVGDSKHFPKSLLEVVERTDPSGIRRTKGMQEVVRRLKGKKLMLLSGGADKLVPYAVSKPFIDELKLALDDGAVVDIVYDGVGHDCTPRMIADLSEWVKGLVLKDLSARLV